MKREAEEEEKKRLADEEASQAKNTAKSKTITQK